MGRCVVAFAPGHISGYFRRVDGDTLNTTGSLGAGIVMSKGVKITLRKAAKNSVAVNGGNPAFLSEALDALGVSAEAFVDAEMPIGAGFGMSGAGLLAAAAAANRLFDLGMSDKEIVSFAHCFEVEHGTGLGDAAASAAGGIDIRTAPGVDGVTERIFTDEPVFAVSLGPMTTPEIIRSPEIMQQLNEAYPKQIPKTLSELISASRSFAEKSGLITPNVRCVLDACDAAGIQASMTMLGEGVFACKASAQKILGQFGSVYHFSVSKTGPVILEDSYV
ncbi:MAG TPA: GHMP kinase [Methanocorpusculum sp.]|nr:GHMP kinase [Methanocorpusculum sp.]